MKEVSSVVADPLLLIADVVEIGVKLGLKQCGVREKTADMCGAGAGLITSTIIGGTLAALSVGGAGAIAAGAAIGAAVYAVGWGVSWLVGKVTGRFFS